MKQTIVQIMYCGLLYSAYQEHVMADGLIKYAFNQDYNESDTFKTYGLTAGGWLAAGLTDAVNTSSRNNYPVSFNDRTDQLQLNQLNVFCQKRVDQQATGWDTGGRIDFMFGSDSRFTQATGLDNKLMNKQLGSNQIALPQAYAELHAPIGQGVTIKLGHFYTILGQEVVSAPNNFFYSHAYAMQYGEPFTHTGLLANYALNDNFSVNAGTVAGWDNFDLNLQNWHALSSVSWTNDKASQSVSWSVISGEAGAPAPGNRTLSSLVVSNNFTEKIQYILQSDFAVQQQALIDKQNAYWYGINQYLFYRISESISLGLRAEWFADASGFRIVKGHAGDYFALTLGINWKLSELMMVRPEIRYDRAASNTNVFGDQSAKYQVDLALDLIVSF